MNRLSKPAVCLFMATIVFFCLTQIDTVQAGSTVGGKIESDTTWTKTDSPYTLTQDVEVNVQITLTIQAGVTVNLQGHTIRTNWGYDEKADQPLHSTMIAKGTSNEPIRFNDGTISLEHTEDSAVEHAVLSSVSISVMYGSPSISYCTITGTGSGTGILCGASESPQIMSNTISGWETGIQTGANTIGGASRGYPQIHQNIITGNEVGIVIILVDYGVGAWDFPKIENNEISGNSEVGVQFEVSGPRWKGGSVDEVLVENNNIYSNTVNAQANAGSTLIARSNWWGTTDTTTIKNSMSGDVVYDPFLTAPVNSEAATYTPTPSLTTAEPSATPTATTSPTETLPQPTSGFPFNLNQVEIAILGALIVIIVLLLVVIALILMYHK